MEDEKIDLQWGKFAGQFGVCLLALTSGIYASLHFFVGEGTHSSFADTRLGLLIGAVLVVGTFFGALFILRVPYRKDIFERRLRNWSMTYSAVVVLSFSAVSNIAFHANGNGDYFITPYMMPGLWLVYYIIYAQYTRYCIAHGRRNSFLDGNTC